MTYAPLHFHSNVTVLLHNNGFVALTQQFKRKHYYGYGSVIYKGEISGEWDSFARELEELKQLSSGI
jgi:hypothetical protein